MRCHLEHPKCERRQSKDLHLHPEKQAVCPIHRGPIAMRGIIGCETVQHGL